MNYSWDLPFNQYKGVANTLLGGWNLAGVTTLQTGVPLTVIDTRGGTAYGTSSTTVENGYSRAQICPGKTYADIRSSGGIKQRLGGNSGGPGYWNASAFCAPTVIGDPEPVFNPATGGFTTARSATDFGNAGVGILPGPGQVNFDAALLKTTRIRENQAFQFRAEFFNLFNHAQFDFAGLRNVNSPTDSSVRGLSVNPRVIQLGFKYIF